MQQLQQYLFTYYNIYFIAYIEIKYVIKVISIYIMISKRHYICILGVGTI